MKRKIITIDETRCDGCGLCIPNCPEGAIRIIDGKARLVSDLFCDGLGACLGHCPAGAITVTEREAQAYSEEKVMENIIRQGDGTIRAHLEHLEEHGETGYYDAAIAVLQRNNILVPGKKKEAAQVFSGCPGSRAMNLKNSAASEPETAGARSSRLTTWPVQLHLVPVNAPHYRGRDLLLAADCVAYALGDFHRDFLRDNVLAIACPKLDEGQEIYLEKITALLSESGIASLTVMTMEVPCCSGLVHMVKQALARVPSASCPVMWKVVSMKGEVLQSTRI